MSVSAAGPHARTAASAQTSSFVSARPASKTGHAGTAAVAQDPPVPHAKPSTAGGPAMARPSVVAAASATEQLSGQHLDVSL